MGCARLVTERCIKLVFMRDSESPVKDTEVGRDAGTSIAATSKNPDHGQGFFSALPELRASAAGLDYLHSVFRTPSFL